MAFVNEEALAVASSAVTSNAGLQTTSTLTNQFTTVSAGVPRVPTPTFRAPRSYADQLAVNPTGVAFAVDPDLEQPSVHQLSVSIEREIAWDTVVEGRYVGTLGRNLTRGIDLNQINVGGDFLDDFLRARNNGFLALAASGVFDPAFNPAIAGSQALTVIPQFGGGLLTNSTVRSHIQTGQVGSLADFYITSRAPGANAAFLPNPGIYAANLVLNGAETDYHAFQAELRRRFKNGVFGQVNYTFGKTLANSYATGDRFEPFLDNARPELERTRAAYHITHIVNANMIVELPFGSGKRFLSGNNVLGKIVGGWQLGSIIHWQSGAPFSILAPRGTFNRAGRSGGNPANSSLTSQQIKALFGIRKLPDGRVFYIDPSVTDPNTGRAVGPDTLGNTGGFANQVFFNPAAGTLGTLQRLQFDGPSTFVWDVSVIKRLKIVGRYTAELRSDFFNVLNRPDFAMADTDINSQTFGRITRTHWSPRLVQLAVRINF